MKNNTKKLGLGVLIAETILNMGLATGFYAQYFMTDIIGINVVTVSTILTVGSIIAIFCSISGGAFITNTKSKFGQYRPWLLVTYLVPLVVVFLMMFNYGSMSLNVIILGIAYALFCAMTNIATTPKYSLYAAMGGSDNDLRNDINGKSWAGYNFSQVVMGLILLPLVYMVAGDGPEVTGWRLVHIGLSILTIIGIIILLKMSKPYDPDNRTVQGQVEEKIKFSSMLKAVVKNRAAWTLVLADILRYTGFMFLFTIMFYPVLYIIGDVFLMSLTTVGVYLAQMLSGLFAPKFVNIFGGRKKMAISMSFITAILYAIFCFFGKTYWGFFIIITLANFTGGSIDAVSPLLYIDAGEYWLATKGEDTRPFLMSMQAITGSVGSALAAPLFGVALVACNYVTDVMLVGSDATTLINWIGLGTGAAYLLFGLILLLHNVSDKEALECIQKNADAGLGMEEDMM